MLLTNGAPCSDIALGLRSLLLLALMVCVPAVALAQDQPLHARIDALIVAGHAQPGASPADDSEFLRRIYLDLAGRIPTPAEARQFLADNAPDKRTRLIDALLNGPEYPRRMQELFHVMLMERAGDNADWTRFLESSFRDNKPWDQMVRDMLAANVDDEQVRGAAFFLTKRLENYGQNPVDLPGLARDVGRLFLGVDLQCAQCHDHLFVDDYKQADFQGIYSFVSHTFIRKDVKFPAVGEKLITKKTEFMSVFIKEPQATGPRLPGGAEIDVPTFAKGEEFALPPDRSKNFPGIPKFSPLTLLSQQLPTAENTAFARNIVNRLWWVMMGHGLVHPLDLHHSDNPPSHPELLNLLAQEFTAHHFDIKWLLGELARTQTYQRSSLLPEGTAALPPQSFLVFNEKPLSSEQVLQSVLLATGELDVLQKSLAPAESAVPTAGATDAAAAATITPAPAAAPVAASDALEKALKPHRDRFLKAFANPAREPEVEFTPSVKAALFLSNDATVLSWLTPKEGNLVDRCAKLSDLNQAADEVYLAVLTRLPSAEERAEAVAWLSRHTQQPAKGLGHLAWALLTSTEFCVNH